MTTHPDLSKQIEDLVRKHVDALRASAAAAVARAFAAVPIPLSARASTQTRPVHPRKKAAPRRGREELVTLGERFYPAELDRVIEAYALDAGAALASSDRQWIRDYEASTLAKIATATRRL